MSQTAWPSQVRFDIFCAEERNNAGVEMSACEVVQKGLASVQKYMEGISDRVSETLGEME